MNSIEFKSQDELRILSVALCVAQDDVDDDMGMYDDGDANTIRGMKRRVDAELEARYAVNQQVS